MAARIADGRTVVAGRVISQRCCATLLYARGCAGPGDSTLWYRLIVIDMESADLAIGVPGLAAIFLEASLKGYEVLMSARNVSADIDHYIHGIKLEQQKLRDWKDSINHVKLSDALGLPERERHLLVVGALARIACLFANMAATEDEYATTVNPELAKAQRASSRHPIRRIFRHFRQSGQEVESSEIETIQSPSSPANPRFRMAEILPNDMNSDQLEIIGKKVAKSDISIQSIKWALLNRTELQGFLERLSGYIQSLVDLSGPASVLRSGTFTDRQFIVPFPRNPRYVERKDIHDRMDELLPATPSNGTQPRAALWGLGGMGKTTIAIEYCYRCWGERPTTSIFWIHANSDEAFQVSYRDIAKRVGIKAPNQGESALQDTLKHWLESPGSGEWIMVIDNLDDLDDLEIKPSLKYIPVQHGTILFTTRDSRILDDSRYAIPKNAR